MSGPSICRIDRRHRYVALGRAGNWHEAGARARSAIRGKDCVVVDVEDGFGACSQRASDIRPTVELEGMLATNAGTLAARPGRHGQTCLLGGENTDASGTRGEALVIIVSSSMFLHAVAYRYLAFVRLSRSSTVPASLC